MDATTLGVKLSWGAEAVLRVSTRMADYVDVATASRLKVHLQPRSKVVYIDGSFTDLRRLARSFASLDTGDINPAVRRTAGIVARRIEKTVRIKEGWARAAEELVAKGTITIKSGPPPELDQ